MEYYWMKWLVEKLTNMTIWPGVHFFAKGFVNKILHLWCSWQSTVFTVLRFFYMGASTGSARLQSRSQQHVNEDTISGSNVLQHKDWQFQSLSRNSYARRRYCLITEDLAPVDEVSVSQSLIVTTSFYAHVSIVSMFLRSLLSGVGVLISIVTSLENLEIRFDFRFHLVDFLLLEG